MSSATTFYNDVEVKGIVSTSLAGKSIGTVTTMPAASSKNKDCAVLYVGTKGTYIPGTIYVSNGSKWVSEGMVVKVDSAVTDGSSNPASGDAIVTYLSTNYQPKITGAATTIDTENLTTGRALVSDTNGKVAVSAVTSTELGYLDGVTSNIQTQLNGKQASGSYVTTETGKGLSTNDYTTEEKTKLSGIASGAQVNVLEGVNVKSASGTTALTVSSKKVTVDLSGYATKSDVSSIPKFAISVVTDLPTSNISTSTIYLKADSSGSGTNVYDEYIYVNSKWEVIGTTMTDLSGYSKKADTVKDLTISGKTITVTKGDGTTSTLTTQDTNTDTKVKQNIASGGSKFPLLIKGTSATGEYTGSVYCNDSVTLQPNSGTITATTFSGNATSATKATQDGSGNVITDTYATKTAVDAKASAIRGTGLSVTWTSDTSVAGYSYKGTITLAGVTANHCPQVSFAAAQAKSGNYSSYAESGAGVVYVWAKVNTAITVDVLAVL